MSPSLHTKDNLSKELKHNQTQPNITEPMKMFRSWTGRPRTRQTTFDMRGSGGCWENKPADETRVQLAGTDVSELSIECSTDSHT